MSKKTFVALIVIIALIAVSVTVFYLLQSTTVGSKVNVGVNVGDVFTYQMMGVVDSHVAFTIPENFVDVNNTKCYRVEITKVEAPIVSYTVTEEFKNGTIYNYNAMINLENGLCSGYPWNIYAANLKVGDLCRPGATDEPTVNSTQTKLYPGGDRDINFVNEQYDVYDPEDPTYTNYGMVYNSIYFDKQMGMMVAYKTTQIFNYPEIVIAVEYRLVEYQLSGSPVVEIPSGINFF